MNLDLAIAISAACFVAGLLIGVIRGWNACDEKWFTAERRGEQIEGPVNEFGDTPAYRVRRVDMMPIDFVPAKPCDQCETNDTYYHGDVSEPTLIQSRIESEEIHHSE